MSKLTQRIERLEGEQPDIDLTAARIAADAEFVRAELERLASRLSPLTKHSSRPNLESFISGDLE